MRLQNEVVGQKLYKMACALYSDDDEIINSFKTLDVEILRFKNTTNLNCRKWALKTIGLKKYNKMLQQKFSKALFENKLPELRHTRKPQPKDLVAYRKKGLDDYLHYAIIYQIKNESITVLSVWGLGGFFAKHPIQNVYITWGDTVDFYRPILSPNTLSAEGTKLLNPYPRARALAPYH